MIAVAESCAQHHRDHSSRILCSIISKSVPKRQERWPSDCKPLRSLVDGGRAQEADMDLHDTIRHRRHRECKVQGMAFYMSENHRITVTHRVASSMVDEYSKLTWRCATRGSIGVTTYVGCASAPNSPKPISLSTDTATECTGFL